MEVLDVNYIVFYKPNPQTKYDDDRMEYFVTLDEATAKLQELVTLAESQRREHADVEGYPEWCNWIDDVMLLEIKADVRELPNGLTVHWR